MEGENIVLKVATWLVPLVFAIVLHEISHGWVANAFGDPTAREQGRLSPNPLRHVDPFGTVALPLVLAVTGAPVFGWAKPVPVDKRRLRNPRLHMILVSLAGPGMNLLLALLATLLLAFVASTLSGSNAAAAFLAVNLLNFVAINLFLALFNLLPVPPFDGGHVVEGLLPRRLARRWARLGRYGFLLLVVLLLVVPMVFPDARIVERVVLPPFRFLFAQLTDLAGLG